MHSKSVVLLLSLFNWEIFSTLLSLYVSMMLVCTLIHSFHEWVWRSGTSCTFSSSMHTSGIVVSLHQCLNLRYRWTCPKINDSIVWAKPIPWISMWWMTTISNLPLCMYNGRLEMVINHQGSPRDRFCPEKLWTRAPASGFWATHESFSPRNLGVPYPPMIGFSVPRKFPVCVWNLFANHGAL